MGRSESIELQGLAALDWQDWTILRRLDSRDTEAGVCFAASEKFAGKAF